MLTPTALMNPTITALETNRSTEPSRSTPATIIRMPVTSDSVKRARAGSSASLIVVDVGDDHGHGPGGLDGHERRAGRERAGEGPDQVAVQPVDRVDAGEQAAREPVGNALDAEDDARDPVVAQRRRRSSERSRIMVSAPRSVDGIDEAEGSSAQR